MARKHDRAFKLAAMVLEDHLGRAVLLDELASLHRESCHGFSITGTLDMAQIQKSWRVVRP
jgi:hypothetical protein